jgi:hypothetical protein
MENETTVKAVQDYLEKAGLKFTMDGDRIILGYQGKNGSFRILVIIDNEKNVIRIMIPGYLTLSTRNRDLILSKLMTLNYQYVLGKFGYDEQDGEVRIEVNIPIDGLGLTYEAFLHGLVAAIEMGDQELPDLLKAVYS